MKRLYLTLCLGLLSCLPLRAAAPVFTEIVAFGDSLSDNGNFAPYPPPFPGSSAYPKQTWVKQLAGRLKIKSFNPTGTGRTAAGTNYAFGGAATKYTVDKGFGYGPPFDQNNLTAQISGHYLKPAYNPAGVRTGNDVLHTITIGGNDIIASSAQATQILSGWSTLDAIAVNVAKSVEGQIVVLAKAGVKEVLWMNLPDFSTAPYANSIADTFGELGDNYLIRLHNAVVAHNDEMDRAILRIRARPDCQRLKILKLDIYSNLVKVQANPAAYGFKNMRDKLTAIPYLGLGGGNPAGKVDEYFFIDELHPTFKAHSLIADEAFRMLATP